VGAKAKVWPDKQCRRVVWLSRAEFWWVLENVEAEEREGGRLLLYFDRDPDQGSRACTGEEGA
jgi:hypothetical protein